VVGENFKQLIVNLLWSSFGRFICVKN